MASKKNALLSEDRGEAQDIPEFCKTLTCTAFLINGLEEHLQLHEDEVNRWRNGEDFAIELPLPTNVVSGSISAKYNFLRASTIYKLYVHEEMRGDQHGESD